MKLEELPLTSNGKLDRKSLPELKGLGIDIGIEYLGPRNEIEEQLVGIWSDVLNIPGVDISVTANFFELGGNSIKILRLQKMLNKFFDLHIDVTTLFRYYSIEKLSKLFKVELYNENNLEKTIDDSIARINKNIDLFNS
ncbi:phosphopantetheine-binding protein [Zhouia spongiae]|uniref:Phosphopantetheine-binding protein n=1 Tax=Zhouia spongiae TaxID=2202721 RepID=A0ABY3YW80_9FLAO|nr:phosphopantetheine-binding protein [Zhouia spongiae]